MIFLMYGALGRGGATIAWKVACFVVFVFFFQAEDGIRDLTVTGVQTCALPIFSIAWLIGSPLLGNLFFVGIAVLPVSMGIAILKYRLYDIDRIISRTLAYAIVTDRKSTRPNSSHSQISYAVFCLKKKNRDRLTNPSLETNTPIGPVLHPEPAEFRHVAGLHHAQALPPAPRSPTLHRSRFTASTRC